MFSLANKKRLMDINGLKFNFLLHVLINNIYLHHEISSTITLVVKLFR
jgi:hypothetical protein